MKGHLPDSQARHRAVTASATNVVVTAGAGTGKTSLLIDRILHLLTRPHNRLSLTQIVAVTFTNKAASELRLRVRHRLRLMKELATGVHAGQPHGYESQSIRTLQESFSDEELAELSDVAMREVERAHIETIHGFASHLLRLYPVEAGVDPSFQEDDGTRFQAHFTREWEQWVLDELDAGGRQHAVWRRMLTCYSLDDLRRFALALTDELIPLPGVPQPEITPVLRSWLAQLCTRGRLLQETYQATLKINRLLDDAVSLLTCLSVAGTSLPEDATENRSELQQTIPPKKPKDWIDEDYEEAKGLIRIAQAIERSSSKSLWDAVQLLSPFVARCRTSFVEQGLVSFNGLLARARALLRDHLHVRAELKAQYQAVIVDEFQDTDPVQYELILFLAEAEGAEARAWHRVRLAPGKLFIVGDPKQSIYAFRRADVGAYDTVVRNHILAQGEQHALQGNFRAHDQLLDPVNRCCARLFPSVSIEGVQPCYEPLLPASDSQPLAHERAELRVVALDQEDANADAASRAEADDLARWLREEVLDKERLLLDGREVPIRPNHIAVLFRTLGPLRIYLEAFRRHHLPCLAEGEKHFYERQEVIDCSHVLRVLTNPLDQLGLVGTLRSPYGGCSDVEVESIIRRGLLDHWTQEPALEHLPPIFSILHALQTEIGTLPIPDAIRYIFEKLPLAELAACSIEGEHALANVLKLRDTMLELATRSGMTLREIVRQLGQWVEEPPEEGERALVEEGLSSGVGGGAIRFLSIHKAKGLEFPMVIVAGLHRDIDHREAPVSTSHDWLTDTIGFRLGRAADLGGIFIETKLAERQRAEQVRLLYVAMTRAQRRLVLSTAFPEKRAKGAFLSLITRGLALDLTAMVEAAREQSPCDRLVENVAVRTTVVRAPQPTKKERPAQPTWEATMPDGADHERRWAAWMTSMERVRKTPLFLSPTRFLTSGDPALSRISGAPVQSLALPKTAPQRDPSDRSAVIGTLAHRVLQGWDFSADPAGMPDWIDACCRSSLPLQWVSEADGLCEELQELFTRFVESEPYAVLRQSEILGREIPFAVPWENGDEQHPSVMEGVIDVMYRRGQEIWIADYKTHRVEEGSTTQVAHEHRAQMEIYRRAAALALRQESLRAQIIFLRSGRSVEV